MKRAALGVALTLAATLPARSARAGSFDELGELHLDKASAASLSFDALPDTFTPTDEDPSCAGKVVGTLVSDASALEGAGFVRVRTDPNAAFCATRFVFKLPNKRARYRATLWARHGSIDALVTARYADDSGLDLMNAVLAPTGRVTSDGWVELASNELSLDGEKAKVAYLRLSEYASEAGVDVDAFELVETGDYVLPSSCTGIGDASCTGDSVCFLNRCLDGNRRVPPLPSDVERARTLDVLAGRMRWFFGGKRSRALYLPKALARLDGLRTQKTSAFQYWNGIARAIAELHDWHTVQTIPDRFLELPRRARLNACFIEGEADLTHAAWPKDPEFPDVLVSHVGPDAGGLSPGDRLVAIDGEHPIRWAQSIAPFMVGTSSPTDPDVFSDFVENLGGPSGNLFGATILKLATTITVLRCSGGSCSALPETLVVADLTPASMTLGPDVECDNRPRYHLGAKGPDETTHAIGETLYVGPVEGTDPSEKIAGLVWDSLLGASVNPGLQAAVLDWKANARGVLLDHRRGNGGTADGVVPLTELVRPPAVPFVALFPMQTAGFDGPLDAAQGLALYAEYKVDHAIAVGSPDFDPTIPVALLIERDASASDFLPFVMKGAPHVRIFGPHATNGAFSTFLQLGWWSTFGLTMGSGESIAEDGSALVGHGVQPDVIVLEKQSDLVVGKDTIHEAALAWVRQELKP